MCKIWENIKSNRPLIKTKKSKSTDFLYDKDLKDEIEKAFEFYLEQYKQKRTNMDILIKEGEIKPSIEYYQLPFDIEKLEKKDIKFLFRLMLKEDKMKQSLIDRQIRAAESQIETYIQCMNNPDWYKSPDMTIEDFNILCLRFIKTNEKNIIKLKAGDYELCKKLLSEERDA